MVTVLLIAFCCSDKEYIVPMNLCA